MAVQDVTWKETNDEFVAQEITHDALDKQDTNNANDYNLEFDYEELDQKIVLREKSEANQSTGLALWTCSQVLTGFLLDNQEYVKDQTVLEIGAGLGLCGIVAHHLGAKQVLSTDGDVDVLNNLRHNIELNRLDRFRQEYNEYDGEEKKECDLDDSIEEGEASILSPQLIWNKNLDSFQEQYGKQSVMMGTDIFYFESSLEPGWKTIDKLLKPDGVFLLGFCPHSVSIEQVLDTARSYGFSYEKPNITGGVEEDEDFATSCSFGYHVFVFRRE
ncbi:hypothetical protein CTEN210_11929 [Chaetoceros tenuissimus]|uniref:Calmodulin-lysine N-methyltransferase n=1 Tax=Chaetoceros tenuissimus TaxID=426638 RepID=A0AAD3D0J5_9STRA|nr:hypothetical protein CTEN210_11929 [Chaetoceros tenuissimus]